MGKFFMIQSGVILVLLYVQAYVKEGSHAVGFKTLGSFSILLALTLVLSLILAFVRKMIQSQLEFRKEMIRFAIYILPIYYVFQLLGWLTEQGYIGG